MRMERTRVKNKGKGPKLRVWKGPRVKDQGKGLE